MATPRFNRTEIELISRALYYYEMGLLGTQIETAGVVLHDEIDERRKSVQKLSRKILRRR